MGVFFCKPSIFYIFYLFSTVSSCKTSAISSQIPGSDVATPSYQGCTFTVIWLSWKECDGNAKRTSHTDHGYLSSSIISDVTHMNSSKRLINPFLMGLASDDDLPRWFGLRHQERVNIWVKIRIKIVEYFRAIWSCWMYLTYSRITLPPPRRTGPLQ